jgi:hypothetical protein
MTHIILWVRRIVCGSGTAKGSSNKFEGPKSVMARGSRAITCITEPANVNSGLE